jgi:hypothetical protein
MRFPICGWRLATCLTFSAVLSGCKGYGDFVVNRPQPPPTPIQKRLAGPEIECGRFWHMWEASLNAMKGKYRIVLEDDINRHVRGLREEPFDKERVVRIHANIWISKVRGVYQAAVEVAVEPPSRPEAPESLRVEEAEEARYGGSLLFKKSDLYEARRVAEERELRDALRAELARIESQP